MVDGANGARASTHFLQMKVLLIFLLLVNICGNVKISVTKIHPVYRIVMRGEVERLSAGNLLALNRNWFVIVGSLGSRLRVTVRSPCIDLLIEFARSEGCDPREVDDQNNTRFHTAALLGKH